MKHIRILSLSLALVLMLGLLAACGKSGSESVSGSESSSDAHSSASTDADTSAPDASQPEEDAPAPEEEPEAPAPEAKPEQKPEKPAPEVKPEVKPETPAPEAKPEEQPQKPAPEAKPEEKPEETPVAPAKVDLAAFFETIFTDPDNAPALVPMEVDALDAFYAGLTAIQTNQRVAYMPMMTAVPCEIVMVECANAADVESVKAIFKTRIDTMVNDHFNYPMVIEAWEKEAKVVSNGNFVALFVVSGMTDEVVSNFNALF